MSSATPLPYNVRYNADSGTIQYEFQSGWIDVPNVGGAVWGSITGTLSDQTDLQAALDAKAPLASPTFTGTVTLPTTVDINGAAITKVIPAADSSSIGVNYTLSNGSTSVLFIDQHNRQVGIQTTSPTESLSVNANMTIAGQLAMGAAHASGACLIDMINPFVGLGVPAMTTTQKNAVTPNRAGNVVFDTSLGKLCVNNGSAWETISSS